MIEQEKADECHIVVLLLKVFIIGLPAGPLCGLYDKTRIARKKIMKCPFSTMTSYNNRAICQFFLSFSLEYH